MSDCDLFVGLIGHYYGSCPLPPNNGKSFTEHEYDEAVRLGKPRLIFIASDDFSMPVKLRESDDSFWRQQAFRERVATDRVAVFFNAPEPLATRVTAAIANWALGSARGAKQKRMANPEHLTILFEGAKAWNTWRVRHPNIQPDLREADLRGGQFSGADFRNANLSNANLSNANLNRASLKGANLRGANLNGAQLVQTDLSNSDMSDCYIYGTSVWDLKLDGAIQHNLIINPKNLEKNIVTVDNIEVAQFIYLLLYNEKIQAIFGSLASNIVLIIGHFISERKAILDILREVLRKRGFVPIAFNFDKPETKDLTETVRLLAGFSRFVIADITKPRSAPLELQAMLPEYMIPFVPIIEDGEEPFATFRDLWVKHRAWVLDPIAYGSVEELVQGLDEAIIKPALARFDELVVKKAEKLRVRRIGT